MKILHVIDSGGLYGAEMMLLCLAGEQAKSGLEPTIGSIAEKGMAEKPLETEALRRGLGIQKFRFANGPNPFGALEVLRFCRKERVDIIHSHGYKANILLGFLPKRLRGLPLVSTIHGWTSTAADTKMRLYEWLDARSLGFVDAVVLVSENMRSHPRLRGRSLTNIYVVHNGMSVADCTTRLPPDFEGNGSPSNITEGNQNGGCHLDQSILDFCKARPTVASIGRLSPEKGHEYLVRAVHLLQNRGTQVNLLIIGEGEERKPLESLIEILGLQQRVFMPGYRKEATHYLKCCRSFVLPSLTEGLPVTLLEAMHARVPVIASEVGGIPEVLKDGELGLLVRPADPEGIANAIMAIDECEGAARHRADGAYSVVVSEFSSRKMCAGYQRIYEHCRYSFDGVR